MIGRCLEKTGETDQALEQYYRNVIVAYFEDREKGVWHSEGAKLWFSKAAWSAVDVLEARKDWRKAVSMYCRELCGRTFRRRRRRSSASPRSSRSTGGSFSS